MKDLNELTLGVDYENMETILKETGKKTVQAIYYRISQLKEKGVIVDILYDRERKPYYLREEADKIINYKISHPNYPKNRNEIKGTRPGKQKVK